MVEEEPTIWTEVEITTCEKDENFDLYKINQLIDSDFSRKPQKSCVLTPTSSTGPLPAAISPTLDLLAPALVNIFIYPMQPLGIRRTSAVYIQLSGFTSAAYIQPSKPTSAA